MGNITRLKNEYADRLAAAILRDNLPQARELLEKAMDAAREVGYDEGYGDGWNAGEYGE